MKNNCKFATLGHPYALMMEITIITNNAMKNQTYQTPIVEVMYLLAETKILAGSGENLGKDPQDFEWV